MKREKTLATICLLLIILYVYTAVAKLIDPPEFTRQLSNQVFPKWTIPILLWALPVSELTVAILIVFDTTRKYGLLGSVLLMTVFTGYMLLVVFKVFDRVPCSCGGVISSMSFPVHLIFNLFFLAISIVGLYINHLFKTNQRDTEVKNDKTETA